VPDAHCRYAHMLCGDGWGLVWRAQPACAVCCELRGRRAPRAAGLCRSTSLARRAPSLAPPRALRPTPLAGTRVWPTPSRAVAPRPRAGYAHKGADGQLHFSGLVATPDGTQMMRTSRVAGFTEADAVKVGEEAGKELKATGPKELFMY
jgi:hypothetical protein